VTEFEQLKHELSKFAADRDWDQFHSPKNLSMALIGEAAELVEHFQWLTEKQSEQLDQETLKLVALEIADIQIYLIRIADKLGVDIIYSVNEKIAINQKRYPVEKVQGSSKKYTEYAD